MSVKEITELNETITSTELFKAMMNNGDFGDENEIIHTIRCMRREVAQGEDPEELLYDMGFEPDYIFDIL